jgi:hypothetical protein
VLDRLHGARMEYRLVYDVRNDGHPWFGVAFAIVPLLLAVACFLEVLQRVRGKRPSPLAGRPRGFPVVPLPLLIVAITILGFFGLFSATKSYEGFVRQQRCQEWAQTGEYQVTEGTVADFQFRKAGSRFRIADLSFDLLDRSAGFTGRFNVPGAAEDSLRDGLRVRVAHHEGHILRVEIAP